MRKKGHSKIWQQSKGRKEVHTLFVFRELAGGERTDMEEGGKKGIVLGGSTGEREQSHQEGGEEVCSPRGRKKKERGTGISISKE